jgi:Tfp pilus assembly protein PilO
VKRSFTTAKPTNVNVKAVGAIVAGLVAFAAIGYLGLVSPQRSKAKDLETQIESTQQQISAARIASQVKPVNPHVDDLFRLTKAMPANPDMPGILLELSRVAAQSGISFDSITPSAPVAGAGFQTLPIELNFQGNYYELSDFIFRLRTLVAKRDDKLDVGGRLYRIDSIDFSADSDVLAAKLSAKAYIYAPGSTATPAATPAAPPAASTTPPPATGSTG